MANMMSHLKQKWGIKNNWDFWAIMLVFSLAGMVIVHERKPIFHILGIGAQTPLFLKIIFYILFVFPTYQFNLLFFSLFLGQFPFFWEKEKRLGRFLRRAVIQR